jgi:hypothetical protein
MPHIASESTDPLSNTDLVIVKAGRLGRLAEMDFSKTANPPFPKENERYLDVNFYFDISYSNISIDYCMQILLGTFVLTTASWVSGFDAVSLSVICPCFVCIG